MWLRTPFPGSLTCGVGPGDAAVVQPRLALIQSTMLAAFAASTTDNYVKAGNLFYTWLRMELPPTWSGVLLGMPGGEMKALGLAYMADMMLAGRCYSSLNAYRSWLAAWFRGNGYAPPPTSDHDFLRFMHGAQNKLRKRSRHRSALTWDLIVRLLGVWLTWGVGKNYMLFVVVAYTFALRFGETVQLQWPAIWDLGVTVQLNVPAFKNWKEVTSVVLSRGHIPDSAMAVMGADWPSDILTSVRQVEMSRLIKKAWSILASRAGTRSTVPSMGAASTSAVATGWR